METNHGLHGSAIADGGDVRFLGMSPPMQALRAAIAKVAQARQPVLVTGETGTGKALVAVLIHQHSDRASGPFVSIRGAAATPRFFQPTAANAVKPDDDPELDIRAANGGTLFVHEVGDLTPEAQTALLLYLQNDGSQVHEPRARLVSSTHADLEHPSHAGDFRNDLFYRIASLRLDVPPLRERVPDVALLATYFLGGELLGRSETARVQASGGGRVSLRETRHIAEREAIIRALHENHGQVPAAAASLGISRAQLYRLIGRLNVDHRLPSDERDQNGISSSGKGSSLRVAGTAAPEAPRSPP